MLIPFLTRQNEWTDGMLSRSVSQCACASGNTSKPNSSTSADGRSKMADRETNRSSALSSCRRIVSDFCAGQSNVDEDKLTKGLIEKIFRLPDFASVTFKLLDYDMRGYLLADDLINQVKTNCQKQDSRSMKSQEFVQLFESCLELIINDPEGKIPASDCQRIFASPGLGAKAFEMTIKRDGATYISINQFIGFVGNLTASSLRHQLSQTDLDKFIAAFKKMAGNKQELTKDEFAKMVSSKKKFFIDRAFKIFDRSGSGTVSLDEYTQTLGMLVSSDQDDAIRFLFRIYDENDEGSLSEGQLEKVLKASMEENGMTFDSSELRDLTHALWEDAGLVGVGPKTNRLMTFDDLKQQLQRHPEFAQGLAESIARWFNPPKIQPPQKQKKTRPSVKNYLFSNINFLFFLGLFLAFNVVFFVGRAFYFSSSKNWDGTGPNYFVMLARANGMCLNFNSVMLLMFILRYGITVLRKLGLSTVLPLDQNVLFHQMTGVLVFFQAWAHAIAHLFNFKLNVVDHPAQYLIQNIAYDDMHNHTLLNYMPPVSCHVDLKKQMQICPNGQDDFYSYWEWLFTGKPNLFGLGLVSGYANLTGLILIVILSIMVCCSMPFVRRSGHFEIFYFTHLLFFAYFGLLLLHAPSCWFWLTGPLSIFAIELTYRLLSVCSGQRGRSEVTAGVILPSKVTGLVVRKPANFKHSPGDWVFVKIPAIAKFEWHPFTISSAPEEKGYFTLHVRGVGGWTNRLYKYFEKEYKRLKEGRSKRSSVVGRFQRTLKRVKRSLSGSMEMDINEEDKYELLEGEDADYQPNKNLRRKPTIVRYSTKKVASRDCEAGQEMTLFRKDQRQPATLEKPLKIYIDGPFGAPASNIFRAKHAVLIATGIGVTPFSSILQSIMHRFWANKLTCPNCNHSWNEDVSKLFRLTKVDFFWINRDQRSFEWFVQLLSQLEIEQAEKGGAMERFLDMHMYMTSALQSTDMRTVGLRLALDLLHDKEKRDLVTGLKSRMKSGRPNWDKVFEELKAQNKGDITVFYCGNPALAGILKKKCAQFGFTYRKEVF